MPEKYYYKSPRRLRREKRKRRIFIVFLFLFLGPVLVLFFLRLYFSSPLSNGSFLSPLRQFIEEKTSPFALYINQGLLVEGGNYAVVIENLKTGENYSLNEDRQFDSASLYKLWIMAVVEKGIEQGNLSRDEVLTAPKKELDITLEQSTDVEDSPTPSPEETTEDASLSATPEITPKPEETISYTVNEALTRMITFSDNYSALLLVDRVGANTIASFLKQQSFSHSSFGSPPKTTASDIASFYEKLYKKEFVGSSKMLSLLKQQEINDRIPKFLPLEVKSAHKTGELYGNKHDAGIVFGKTADYIIVVLSDTNNAAVAAKNIANFSKKVYEYFD